MKHTKHGAQHGKEAFIEYYQSLFDSESERQAFFQSLSETIPPILRFHPHNTERIRVLWETAGLPFRTLEWCSTAALWPAEASFNTFLPGYAEHLFYPMSASSLLPVLALQAKKGERILDACAAPGGKALFIADETDRGAELIANDTSPERRRRMQNIFFDYGHREISIMGAKAETLFKKYPEYFDKILVDAPCSSEKHVWNSPTHLAHWSHARIRQLAQRQIALLAGLFLALKPGGRMVYATCAVTPEEDEEVVARLLKKKKDAVQLHSELGRRILPHRDGMDPMFIAVFERMK